MGIFNDIFGTVNDFNKDTRDKDAESKTDKEAKLLLRKEELDVEKNRIQTGDVELSKEIIEEQKTVDVPVTREEVVIERKTLNNEHCDSPITDEETIRIPVSEERVNIDKHTVVTGEVSAHKRDIEDIRHIDETLKREEARINTTGNPNILDSSAQQHHR
jgi:uncharacterized protein (TIGR02271 family)